MIKYEEKFHRKTRQSEITLEISDSLDIIGSFT